MRKINNKRDNNLRVGDCYSFDWQTSAQETIYTFDDSTYYAENSVVACANLDCYYIEWNEITKPLFELNVSKGDRESNTPLTSFNYDGPIEFHPRCDGVYFNLGTAPYKIDGADNVVTF